MSQTIKITQISIGSDIVDTNVYALTDTRGSKEGIRPAFITAGQIKTGKAIIRIEDESLRELTLTCQSGLCAGTETTVSWGVPNCSFTISLSDTLAPSPTPTSTPSNTPTNTPTSTPASTPGATPTSTPTGTPASTPASTPNSTPTNTPTPTSTLPNCEFTIILN